MYSTKQVNKSSEDQNKEYHLKKLEKLSLKTVGEIPQLEDPNQEQKSYIDRKMRDSARNWEANI